MSTEAEGETLHGIAGAGGIAVARAHVLGTGRVGYPQRRITADEADAEWGRFEQAVRQVQHDLLLMVGRMQDGGGDAAILEAYAAMVGDGTLARRVEQLIRADLHCADWAVAGAIRGLADSIRAVPDAYLRDRARDVEFAGRQLLQALGGKLDPRYRTRIDEPSVVVARDLSPADTAAMVREPVVGIVTEVGSRTSHTAIMARALKIPAVVGVHDALQRIRHGAELVVDGLAGRVVVQPSELQRHQAERRSARYQAFAHQLADSRGEPARTRDGTRVELRANIELPSEAETAREQGAEGVGLFRTEFLYVDRLLPPTEREQAETYGQVVESMAGQPVTLRTFDIGGDKFVTSFQAPEELNPLLGLRAVRLALSEPAVFMEQLRAMVRAAAWGDVRIMVPFVSSIEELSAVRAMLAQAQKQVRERGLECPDVIPLGVMIELPAAAVMADVFAEQADFLSIGTNDLIQYALAVDRTNRELASLASPFHPAVLRLVDGVIRAARQADCPVAVCGAMAAVPFGALLLVGLGLRELSMEAVAIPEIKAALGRVELAELEEAAAQALEQHGAAQVQSLLERRFEPRLRDLLLGDPEPGAVG